MFDLAALTQAAMRHGKVARIVLAQVQGSAPRQAGTAMLVWDGGSSGTIGGGQLELQCMEQARKMLAGDQRLHLRRAALGPALNQCCGGAVSVVTEVFDTKALTNWRGDYPAIHARAVSPDAEAAIPEKLHRKLARVAAGSAPLPLAYQNGWLAEALWQPQQQVVIYGAGHVGKALAAVLAPLPQFDVVLTDLRLEQLADVPQGVRSDAAMPTEVMAKAAPDAAHFIMTPEHDYDLELCHHLLRRTFAAAGLIGSATKWARFRKRLAALGHDPAQISRIACPIGDPAFGKHPQAIALSIAAHMLAPVSTPRKVSHS